MVLWFIYVSIYLSIYLFIVLSIYIYIFVYLFAYRSVYISFYLSVYQCSSLSIYLFICLATGRSSYLPFSLSPISFYLSLSIYPSIHPSIYLSTYLPIYLPTYLPNLSIYRSIYLSIYLSVHLSVYLSVCLSICSFTCLSFLPSFLCFFLLSFFLSFFFFNSSTSKKVVRESQFFKNVWLRNVLRATTAGNFWTSQRPKMLRTWGACSVLASKCASRHSGVQFLIYLFVRFDSFSSLTFFLFLSLLWLFPPLLLHLSILSKVWLLNFLRWMMIWMVGSGFRIGGSSQIFQN